MIEKIYECAECGLISHEQPEKCICGCDRFIEAFNEGDLDGNNE